MNPQPSNALSGLRMTDRLVSPPPLPSPLPPLNSPGPHSTYPNRNLDVEGVSPWAIHPAILNRVIFHDTIFFQDPSNSRNTRTPAPKREWRNEGMKTSRALTPPPPLTNIMHGAQRPIHLTRFIHLSNPPTPEPTCPVLYCAELCPAGSQGTAAEQLNYHTHKTYDIKSNAFVWSFHVLMLQVMDRSRCPGCWECW